MGLGEENISCSSVWRVRKVTKLSVTESRSGAKVAAGTHNRVYGTQPKH